MTPSRGPGPLVRAAVREGRPARTAADDAAGAGDEAARAARLRAVYDLAPIGLCLVDRRMRFLEVNDRLAALNGVPAAAHLGRTLREVLPPALADALEPAYARVLAAGEAIEDLEIARPAPAAGGGGAPRRWLVRLHPVPAPGGGGRGGRGSRRSTSPSST
jgi:PAS domain-containing protein